MTLRLLEDLHPDAGIRVLPRPAPAPPAAAPLVLAGASVAAPSRWTALLLGLAAMLSAASFAVFLVTQSLGHPDALDGELRRVLYVDSVSSVPAWFSTLVLAACAQTLWVAADAARAAGQPAARWWRALSAAFALLSLDELVSLHGPASSAVRSLLTASGASLSVPVVGIAVTTGAVLLLAAAIGGVRFLAALPRATRVTLVAGGALFVTGGVVLDALGTAALSAFGAADVRFGLLTAVEEALEMFGPVLVLAAVRGHVEALRRS